jgi:hypothetical protein
MSINDTSSDGHSVNLARLSRMLVEDGHSLKLLLAEAAARFDGKPGPAATALVEAIIDAHADIDVTVEAWFRYP